MDIKSFVKNKLSEALRLFPSIQFRVEYDRDSNCTSIEVTPERYFKEDSSYIEWENKVFEEGFELFPEENIYFFSTNSITTLERADEIYQLTYQDYNLNTSFLRAPYSEFLSGLLMKEFEKLDFPSPAPNPFTFKKMADEGNKSVIDNKALNNKLSTRPILFTIGEYNFAFAA